MVARFVRDEEVVGSNPATPTSEQGPDQGNLVGAFFVHAAGGSGSLPGQAVPVSRCVTVFGVHGREAAVERIDQMVGLVKFSAQAPALAVTPIRQPLLSAFSQLEPMRDVFDMAPQLSP